MLDGEQVTKIVLERKEGGDPRSMSRAGIVLGRYLYERHVAGLFQHTELAEVIDCGDSLDDFLEKNVSHVRVPFHDMFKIINPHYTPEQNFVAGFSSFCNRLNYIPPEISYQELRFMQTVLDRADGDRIVVSWVCYKTDSKDVA